MTVSLLIMNQTENRLVHNKKENCLFERNTIVVTVFILITYPTKVRLIHNQKENRPLICIQRKSVWNIIRRKTVNMKGIRKRFVRVTVKLKVLLWVRFPSEVCTSNAAGALDQNWKKTHVGCVTDVKFWNNGDPIKGFLKPLKTIECCDIREVSGGPMMPRDVSFSDSYKSDRCCLSSEFVFGFGDWNCIWSDGRQSTYLWFDYFFVAENRNRISLVILLAYYR